MPMNQLVNMCLKSVRFPSVTQRVDGSSPASELKANNESCSLFLLMDSWEVCSE